MKSFLRQVADALGIHSSVIESDECLKAIAEQRTRIATLEAQLAATKEKSYEWEFAAYAAAGYAFYGTDGKMGEQKTISVSPKRCAEISLQKLAESEEQRAENAKSALATLKQLTEVKQRSAETVQSMLAKIETAEAKLRELEDVEGHMRLAEKRGYGPERIKVAQERADAAEAKVKELEQQVADHNLAFEETRKAAVLAQNSVDLLQAENKRLKAACEGVVSDPVTRPEVRRYVEKALAEPVKVCGCGDEYSGAAPRCPNCEAMQPKPASGPYSISKEWCEEASKLEEGCEVGAGRESSEHVVTCNADRRLPRGCSGCSCYRHEPSPEAKCAECKSYGELCYDSDCLTRFGRCEHMERCRLCNGQKQLKCRKCDGTKEVWCVNPGCCGHWKSCPSCSPEE